jgi:hypothetical protein
MPATIGFQMWSNKKCMLLLTLAKAQLNLIKFLHLIASLYRRWRLEEQEKQYCGYNQPNLEYEEFNRPNDLSNSIIYNKNGLHL